MAWLNFLPTAVDRKARVEPLVAGQAAHRPQPKQVHQPVEALAVQRIARPAFATGAQERGRKQIRLLRCARWFAAQQSASTSSYGCLLTECCGRKVIWNATPGRGTRDTCAARRKVCHICQARGIRVSHGPNCQNTMRRPAPALPQPRRCSGSTIACASSLAQVQHQTDYRVLQEMREDHRPQVSAANRNDPV